MSTMGMSRATLPNMASQSACNVAEPARGETFHGSVEKHARLVTRVWTGENLLNQAMSDETERHARVHTADPNTSPYSQGEAC